MAIDINPVRTAMERILATVPGSSKQQVTVPTVAAENMARVAAQRSAESMPGVTKNLVSPVKQLLQKANDLAAQRAARKYYGVPESAEAADFIKASQIAGPRPTIYNATTGEWGQVDPYQARTFGVPIGPSTVNPRELLHRMWSGETARPLPLYGSDIIPT
jgi:hypothetical protein